MGMLRVALAMAVLLSHLPIASFKFMGGGLAVQAFFIISGFYMALVLEGKYADRGLFYSNRLLRIFPTYGAMVVLAAIGLFGFKASATSSPEIFQTAYSHLGSAVVLGIENIVLVGQDLLFWFKLSPDGSFVFDPFNTPPTDQLPLAWQPLLVPQSWSLSLELMFYAIAPFLARLSWRWLALLAALSIGLRLCGYLLPVDYGLWQGRLFPTTLFLFLLGMLAHRALPLAERFPRVLGWAVCAATLAFVVLLPKIPLGSEVSRWVAYAVIAVAAPFIFNATRGVALDRWIGDLSYPLYLCHLAVIGLVLTFTPPHGVWVAIGGSLAVSIALLLLVDNPVDRWRQARVARRQAASAPA